jgi:hypothetical protein
MVAVIVGLAVAASSRGSAASFRLAGSFSLGTAAGLCLYLAADAAYDGGAATIAPPGLLAPLVLTTTALFVPTTLGRFLAVVGLGCVVANYFVDMGLTVNYGTAGALVVLLLVAAAAGRDGRRRTGVGAMVGAFVLAVLTSTVAFGEPLPWPAVDAQATLLPGIASAVLVPMVYWSGRRLLWATNGWVAATPAFAGSVLWLMLLIGPASDPTAIAAGMAVLVLAMLAGRTVRRRMGQPEPIGTESLTP